MISSLLSFLGASVLLTISPGPDNIYVLVQGISNGKKAGIVLTSGLVSGVIVHTSLVAFGVSVIIQNSPMLFYGIQYLGAAYLLLLAYKVYKSENTLSIKSTHQSMGFWKLYRRGFLMNVLNPKVSLFFLALFPGFLWDKSENTIVQFYALGVLFMLQAFIIFSCIAIFAERINILLTEKSIHPNFFKYLQVLTFFSIALYLLIS